MPYWSNALVMPRIRKWEALDVKTNMVIPAVITTTRSTKTIVAYYKERERKDDDEEGKWKRLRSGEMKLVVQLSLSLCKIKR